MKFIQREIKKPETKKPISLLKKISNFKFKEPLLFIFSLLLWSALVLGLYFLVWIVFIPIFILLLRLELKKRIIYSALYSLISTIIYFYWVSDYHEWAFLFIVFLHTIVFFIFFNSAVWLTKKTRYPYSIGMIPLLWGILLIIFHFTPFGNFPLLYAYFQPTLGILMHFLTSYGITLLILLSNSIIILYYYSEKDPKLLFIEAFLLAIVLSFFIHSNFAKTNEGEPITIALVQPNLQVGWNYRLENPELMAQKHVDLTLQAKEKNPDIIVWPEYSVLADLSDNTPLRQSIAQLSKNMNTTIVLGSVIWLPEQAFGHQKQHDTMFIFNPDNKTSQYIAKKPIPFEFAVIPGEEIGLTQWNGHTFGLQICFEETQIPMHYEQRKQGAEFIISIANDNAFTNFHYGLKLASQFAKLQAAEQQLYVARATNTGITQIVNPRGKVIAKLQPNREGVLVKDILI